MHKKQVESTVIQTEQWMIISTYLGKSSPLSHDRNEERIKIIVSSLNKADFNQFMYTFDIVKLEDYGLVNAKEFKDLKKFHYYLKFNPENVRFKVKRGEGVISVMFATNEHNKTVIAKIVNGSRFIAENKKQKDERIRQEEERIKEQQMERQNLDKQFKERNDYPQDTMLMERVVPVQAVNVRKLIIRSGFMDAESEQCEMKNDREIDRLAIDRLLKLLPKLVNLESLTIQWHKMSTSKQINEIIKACSSLKLKQLNFDHIANGFDKTCIQNLQKCKDSPLRHLQDLNIFFNISDQDNYFDQAWWHPEHTEKYKGKTPIEAEEWSHLFDSFKNITSVWIPNNTQPNYKLLNTIGCYEDQFLQQNYWKAIQGYCKEQKNKNNLTSLCISKVKDLKQSILSQWILSNRESLQYFMLNWCDKETEKALSALAQCQKIKYIHLRHSPLQQNTNVTFEFLMTIRNGLEFLSVDNFKNASKGVQEFIKCEHSNSLKQFGAPRNDWISAGLIINLSKKPNLTKLNLYNVKFKDTNDIPKAVSALADFKFLKVLNLGSTELNLNQISGIVKNLKYLKKLNISDIKCEKVISNNVYTRSWDMIRYPKDAEGRQKPYEKLDNNEKKEFLLLLNNADMDKILPLIPRVTHFDIRNLGIDERPFMNPKLAPSLRYIGCEFQLYKKLQTLERRGITFV